MKEKMRKFLGLSSWKSWFWPQSIEEVKRQILGVLIFLPFAVLAYFWIS